MNCVLIDFVSVNKNKKEDVLFAFFFLNHIIYYIYHMDIPIYVGVGLLLSGYLLNREGKQTRAKPKINTKKKEDLLENKKAGGHNIYDSGYFQKVREIEDERVIANFEKGFDPINTNIIPHYFNTLNETQTKRVRNPKYDKNVFRKELAKIMKTTPIELSILEPTPNDLTDINQDASVETGGWNGSPPKALYAETELNRGWSELITRPSNNRGDNNRDSAQQPSLTHNNMVPFFGGSTRQNMNIDNRMMADKLETFTGQFKLDQQHKTEATPLFAPVQQNLEQLMEPRELDRYVTSTQIRNNELPFEQIHVGPGLNDGYTARPSGGFHNPLRILPKTIDQLLVNPRVVKEGRVIRGKNMVDKRTARQLQYKYRPELLVTNFDGERNFTTVGVRQKPMTRSGVVQMPTNRQKSKKVMGNAVSQSGSKNTPLYLTPKGKISHKPNFKNTPFRNAVKAEAKKHHNNQQLRFENRKNERSTTQINYGKVGHCFTNCKFDIERGQTYLQDEAKKTRNESYILAPNPTGYVDATTQKGIVYDPNNQTKTTVRETTEQNIHLGQAKNDQIKGVVYDPNDQLPTTIRESSEQNNHNGYTQISSIKGQVYDPNVVMKTTTRETNEQNTHNGYIQTNNVKGQVYDPFDLTRMTIRQTTEDNLHLGTVQNNNVKGRVYDPNQLIKTTSREITENNDHIGPVQMSNVKGQVYDPNQLTKTTIRQTSENNDHIGQVQMGNVKGQVYDPSQLTKTTSREITENNDRLGQINQNSQRGKVYDINGQLKTTIKETTEHYTHLGDVSNTNNLKQKVYDPNNTAKTTIKETTERDKHLGIVGNNQSMKHIVYNPNDVPMTTVKETTEKGDYMGISSNSQQTKHIAYDPNDVSKTTIKETTEQGNYLGVSGNTQQMKHIAYDPFDSAQTTHRETTEQNDYMTSGDSQTLQNGKGYQIAPTDTKNTQRQFYSDFYHVGGAGQADAPSNQQLYNSAYNMHQDKMKEVVAEGRYPTLSSMKLSPGKTDVNIEIKKLECDQVNQYSAMRAPINCNQRKTMDPCELTSFKNNLPPTNTYFDPSVLKPYINNPLAQSLHSWA